MLNSMAGISYIIPWAWMTLMLAPYVTATDGSNLWWYIMGKEISGLHLHTSFSFLFKILMSVIFDPWSIRVHKEDKRGQCVSNYCTINIKLHLFLKCVFFGEKYPRRTTSTLREDSWGICTTHEKKKTSHREPWTTMHLRSQSRQVYTSRKPISTPA